MGGNTDVETNFIAPTVLTDVTSDSPVMSEEIFGPILPVMTFDNIDEVVKVINNKPKPLGLYIFSSNRKNIDFILPKKKPLIAGSIKPDTSAKKSKYYNKKDFEIAKKAISEMKQAKWPAALKTAKKARDKSIYNFIQWRHLLTKGNKASYLSLIHI